LSFYFYIHGGQLTGDEIQCSNFTQKLFVRKYLDCNGTTFEIILVILEVFKGKGEG